MDRSRLRIAVIDSGVNPSHPHISRVDGGFPENDFLDRLGHGTAVMAAIQEKAPDAEYFAVRVFDRVLRTNIDALLAAIEWSIDHHMDIVNLSLGTANPAHAEKFAPFIGRTIIVAAAGAFPGDLPGVIRVAPDPHIPRGQYRRDAEIFYASGYPRPIAGVPPERNLNGVSFAVANMTGFVARACKNLQTLSHETLIAKL
jgi:subtilisin family serine protease